jgi:xanthine dehydrogenase YagR molybdenum-binding subunit
MAVDTQGRQDVSSVPVAGAPKPANTTINTEVTRIDAKYKTTGTAKYSSNYNLPGMVYAVPVCSTLASGTISSIDSSKASAMRDVVKVYTRESFPKVYRADPSNFGGGRVDERRPPFSDDVINYAGQYVALVVAMTLNQAREAADAVFVRYNEQKATCRATSPTVWSNFNAAVQ